MQSVLQMIYKNAMQFMQSAFERSHQYQPASQQNNFRYTKVTFFFFFILMLLQKSRERDKTKAS